MGTPAVGAQGPSFSVVRAWATRSRPGWRTGRARSQDSRLSCVVRPAYGQRARPLDGGAAATGAPLRRASVAWGGGAAVDPNVSLVETGACGGGPVFAAAPLGLAHVSGVVPPLSLACPTAAVGDRRGAVMSVALLAGTWTARIGCHGCHRGRLPPLVRFSPPRAPPAQPPPRQQRPRGGGCVFVPALLSGVGFPAGTRLARPCQAPPGSLPTSPAPAPCRPRRPFGVCPPQPDSLRASGPWDGGVWRKGSPAVRGARGIRPLRPGECGWGWGVVARGSAGLLIAWRGPGDRWGPPLRSGHRRACASPVRERGGPHEVWAESAFFFFRRSAPPRAAPGLLVSLLPTSGGHAALW